MNSVPGVYGGNMLDFPEQFQSYEFWRANANFDDDWTPIDPPGFNRGVFHNDRSGIKQENGMTVQYSHYYLWTRQEMEDGYFVRWRGIVYRVLHDDDWTASDGFTRYHINRVVGSDGTGSTATSFNNGANLL